MALYYATIKDELTGVVLIEDLECEIEAEVSDTYRLSINDVLVDGVSLFKGDKFSQALACRIASQVEDDDALLAHFGVAAYGVAAQRAELGTW